MQHRGRAQSGPRIVSVPGDKSLTHRALIFAALASGTSRIANLQVGGDAQSTAGVLRALGCAMPSLPADGGAVTVVGRGLHGLTAPVETLDCGNSGTTARLMLGVLAGCPFRSVLSGDASLRARPMRRVTAPLARMGAQFDELQSKDHLPIAVRGGALRPLRYTSPHASAQVKSALLLAGLTGGAEVSVTEPTLSRDHTERVLRALGVPLSTQSQADGSAVVSLVPVDALQPLDFTVPGDFSAAAFLLAYGLLGDSAVRVDGVGLNPGRIGLLAALGRMGATIHVENQREESGEPVGDVTAEPSRLVGTTVGGVEIPSLLDEVPVLAALAAYAEGETVIRDAHELRVKESDRLRALVVNLRALGVDAEELPDGLVVRGGAARLEGTVRTFDDHRIAMAFGVLAALPGNHVELDDPGAAAVSFPDFWDVLGSLARSEASA